MGELYLELGSGVGFRTSVDALLIIFNTLVQPCLAAPAGSRQNGRDRASIAWAL